jgi:hypothetical protein
MFGMFLFVFRINQDIIDEYTSGKKAIGGALFWLMRGVYVMRHHCHATSNNLSVAHFNMRHA